MHKRFLVPIITLSLTHFWRLHRHYTFLMLNVNPLYLLELFLISNVSCPTQPSPFFTTFNYFIIIFIFCKMPLYLPALLILPLNFHISTIRGFMFIKQNSKHTVDWQVPQQTALE